MSDDLDGFLGRVKARAGHTDIAAVERAVRATLRTLGGHLGGVPPVLHDALPRALRPELAAGQDTPTLRPAALYQQVAEQVGLRVGVALELVQSTAAELGARLPESARETLRSSLPPAWAALVPGARARERSRPMSVATTTERSGAQPRPRPTATTTERSGLHRMPTAASATESSGTHRLPTVTEGSGMHRLPTAAATTTEGSGAHRLSTGRPGAHDEESTPAAGRSGSRQTLVDSDDDD